MKLTHIATSAVASLLATALAGSAQAMPIQPSNPAGDAGCTLSSGLPASIRAAHEAALACISAPPEGVSVRADLVGDLLVLSERERVRAGVEPVAERSALDEAALFHAIDMASRGYAAHEDLEGRDHLYRVRLMDRRMLVGASGANVTVIPADGADGAAVFAALALDPVNRENMARERFTDMGLGVAEAGGKLYVVQLFVESMGELDQPMPLSLVGGADLGSSLAAPRMAFDGWTLASLSGASLDRGLNPSIGAGTAVAAPAALEVEVSDGLVTRTLKGPLTGE